MQTDANTSSQDHDELKMKLSKLQSLLEQISINDLCYFLIIEAKNKTLPDHVVDYNKLRDYILAIGLSTPAIKTNQSLPENWLRDVLTLAQELLVEYVAYTGGIKASCLSDPNYFGTSMEEGRVILARLQSALMQGSYEDAQQIKDEINALYDNFNQEIKKSTGLDLKKIIAICDKGVELSEVKCHKFSEALKPANNIHQEYIKRLDACKNVEEEEEVECFARREMGRLKQELKYGKDTICFSRSELVICFTEEEISSFETFFTKKRSVDLDNISLKNINEYISLTLKPFIQVDADSFCIPLANSLYRSLRFHIESILIRDPKTRERLQKYKGKYLEVAARQQLETIFEDLGIIYQSVFETPNSQKEHDILIIYQKTLLITECKTTLITDYFSGLSKDGYQKLKEQFKRSIQAGYDQGLQLKKLIMNQEQTKLYDQKGKIIVTINRNDFTSIECICITLENEGALATSLDILLKKEDDWENYPYSINLRDLTVLATCKDDEEIQLTPRKFVRFLQERKHLHGKLFSNDELDYWGCFLKEGAFKSDSFPQYKGKTYANIFDEAWYRRPERASTKTTLQL